MRRIDGKFCSATELANILNISEQRVRQLVKDRIIPRVDRGKYEILPAVKGYIMYLQQLTSGSAAENIDVIECKNRLLKASTIDAEEKAKIRTIERRKREGELLERAEIKQQWVARCVELKSAMLAVPIQVGFRFQDPDIRNVVEEEIESAITEILETYSRRAPYVRVKKEAEFEDDE